MVEIVIRNLWYLYGDRGQVNNFIQAINCIRQFHAEIKKKSKKLVVSLYIRNE